MCTLDLSDGRILSCPLVVTGRCLTDLVGQPTVTFGSAIPLKNGDVLRVFCYVGADEKLHDLSNYHDLFLSNRQWYGRIQQSA